MVQALQVGDSVQRGLDSFFGYIPQILGFLVVLLDVSCTTGACAVVSWGKP